MRPLISSLRRSPSSKSFIFTVGPKIVADSRSANVRLPPPTVASGSLNSSATAHTTHSPNQPPQMALTSYNPGKAKGQSEAMEEFVEKAIYQCRFMAFFGVMGSLVGSILCFVKGCTFVVAAFVDYFANHGKVIVQLVEAIDVYLLGTVMLVFGMGLFELFVSNLDVPDSFSDDKFHNRSNFFGLFTLKERPKWLEIKSVNELKTKLGHVIVMLLLIGLFEKTDASVTECEELLNSVFMEPYVLEKIQSAGVLLAGITYNSSVRYSTKNLMAVAIRPLESRKNSVLGLPLSQHRVPPSLPSFTINRYKKIEADAFRPTSSGHSPGVGHFEPPTAVDIN